MKKNSVVKLFIAIAVALIVTISGCIGEVEIGKVSPTPEESSQTPIEEKTPQEQEVAESTPSPQPEVKEGEIYDLTHIEYSPESAGLIWISLWIDNPRWKSTLPDFISKQPGNVWFYSSGKLFAFEYGDETLYDYVKEGSKGHYPWTIAKLPYDAVGISWGGPEGSVVVLDSEGNLHLIVYDNENVEYWPSEENAKFVYLDKVKREFSWKVGGQNLVAGWDYDGNHIYYIAWGGNEVWIVSFTGDEIFNLIDGTGKKPTPTKLTFNSQVKDVMIGYHGFYVWEGDKLHIFGISTGEESSTIEVPRNGNYYIDIGEGEDVVTIYDGEKAIIVHVSNGEVESKEVIKLPGYSFVGYTKTDDYSIIFAFKENKVEFYSYDPSITLVEYEGSLELPAKVEVGKGEYFKGKGVGYIYFWGADGKYYIVVGSIVKETTGESAETEVRETQTSTQGDTESEIEVILSNFNIEYTRIGELWGAKVHLKKAPDYKNINDWLQIRAYEPAGLPGLYLAYGNYLVEITSGLKTIVEKKEPLNNYKVLRYIYVLPTTPRDFTIGFYSSYNIFMAGKDGRLYLLYDHSLNEYEDGVKYVTYGKYLSWDIDADGVNYMRGYRDSNLHLLAWKDNRAYILTYTSDQFFEAEKKGLPKVEPVVLTLPERIVAIYDIGRGRALIRTEGGIYLYDIGGYYGYGPDKLYTLLENFPGKAVFLSHERELVIYNKNKFYWVRVSSKYDANDKNVPVVKVIPSDSSIQGVVAFSPMYNTYNFQLAVGFEKRIALYNVSFYYDDQGNRHFKLIPDISFEVPFTPELVYGEDECYCHVHFHEQYFYVWAGNDYYVLFGPNHGPTK
ncbi:hypothetical protein [Pyrococcus abyssi]|nr:hypothetical protein [Pyrococcus abyssi]CCE70129.1 TPA: hypothetical protein PAB1881 [Pyrococcus abyssi GE5]